MRQEGGKREEGGRREGGGRHHGDEDERTGCEDQRTMPAQCQAMFPSRVARMVG